MLWDATTQWVSQFFVLLYKNLKLRFKSKGALIAEILAPIVFFMLWVSFMAAGLPDSGLIKNKEVEPLNKFVRENKILLFAPNTSEVNEVMSLIANTSLATENPSFLAFNTYDQMYQYYNNQPTQVFAGLLFGEFNGTSPMVNISTYSISMDNMDMARTNKVQDGQGYTATNSYLSSGFVSLQVAVDEAILKIKGGASSTNVSVVVNQFSSDNEPLWKQWERSSGFGQAGAIFFLIGLFASCFRMMTNRVAEKEKKIRELLRMGGLRTGTESAAWWVTVCLIAIPPIVAGIFILQAAQIYRHSSIGLVILLFVFGLFSLIALSQLLCVFVNKAKFAGVFGLILVLVFGAIGIAVSVQKNPSPSLMLFLCIFSPTGFAIGNGLIFKLEDQGFGMHSHDYNNADPALRDVIGLLFFDCVVYIALSWYFDAILPGEYGTARSPLFIFRKKFWQSLFASKRGGHLMSDTIVDNNQDIEMVGPHMQGKEAVVMRDVRKEFVSNGRRKVAVDDLSVTLYEDQITALLGHNGAGKTTTISMLTGLLPPTRGEAYINGWSIVTEMDQIRSSLLLGVCPQANVLWDEFSVEDHLKIHAGLKGVNLMEIRSTIDAMIKDLGLEEKRHTPSAALSGGQKRKLQLAISFLGSCKVIFLDEPTSGMDPVTRRSVWDFLNKYKTGKAIVLTTHFMDEADILGDRIVVVSQGKVRCAGTSLFLKSRFGVGYLLTMVKSASCNPASLDALIKSHVKDATKLSEFGAELSYRLPSKDLTRFSELFAELDKSQESLGIDSYGISLTTLEEVFLRIGIEEKEKEEAEQAAIDVLHGVPAAVSHSLALGNKPPSGHSFSQQLYALFIKRIQCGPRDYRTLLFSIVIPLALVVGAIALGKSMPMTVTEWFEQSVDPLLFNGFNFSDTHVTIQGGQLVGSDLIVGPAYVQIPYEPSINQYQKSLRDNVAALAYDNSSIYENSNVFLQYQVWINKTYTHTLPVSVNLIHSALLQYMTNGSSGIQTTNRPFQHVLTAGELAISGSNPNNVIYFALLIMAAFSMILGGLIMPIAQEKALNIKRLLLVSGTSKLAYWISAFMWDMMIMFTVSLVTLILLAIVQMKGFSHEGWGAIFLVLILYALAGLPMTYVFSLRIRSHATAMAQVFAYHYLVSFIILTAYVSIGLNNAFSPSEGLNTATKIIAKVFCALSPNFALGYSFLTILDFYSPTPRNGRSWLTMDVLGFACLMLLLHAVLWWCLLLLIEYRSSMKIRKLYRSNVFHEVASVDEDSDVVAERRRVENDTDDVITVRGMRKEYPDKKGVKVAVANLSLGVPMGQCFGLLGMNGAGKSTTLGVLSADIAPTAGDVFLNHYNLQTDPGDALRYFGWCPQFDALIETMTGREQLTLYARVKGLPESVIPETVSSFLEVLDMEYLADRLAGGYSGGNKRKLSLAIAMIGNPPIVFLDEPSTGMDPLSKRLMWRVITQLGQDKAIMVTTHYMEECEALCSRIGIMSQGRLVCLGSSQHLKSRFATGYTVQIKAKPGNADAVRVRVASVFPHAQLTDAHDDMLAYQLPVEGAGAGRIAPVFAALVDMREFTEDYAVSQTTLEQVFLKLAKERENPQD